MELTSNRKHGFKRRAVITGKPLSGKSFLAGSASAFWPKAPGKTWTKLEDTIWIPADRGATDGFLEKKIEVPEVPLLEELEAAGPDRTIQAIKAVMDLVADKAAKIKNPVIVYDTATSMDEWILGYWNSHPPMSKGSPDGWGIYRNVVAQHDRLLSGLQTLPGTLIVLLHCRASSDEGAEARVRATSVAGAPTDIVPDFFYAKTAMPYRKHFSLWIMMSSEKAGAGWKRRAHFESTGGFEAKNRFQDSLGSYMDNPNMTSIFEKVEAKIKEK